MLTCSLCHNEGRPLPPPPLLQVVGGGAAEQRAAAPRAENRSPALPGAHWIPVYGYVEPDVGLKAGHVQVGDKINHSHSS